jgi:transposase
MVIASEIGDIKRFPTQWKLVSYAGLAPTQHQSGEYERRGGITKQGSKWPRWILVQAAQHARQHDPRFKAYYERVAKRKGKQKAIVAVAKEMLVVIWFMPKTYSNSKRLECVTSPRFLRNGHHPNVNSELRR